MSLPQGLFNLMISTPEIAELVTNGATPPQFSIHMGTLDKGYWLPAIRFSVITSTPIVTNSGTASLTYERIQFDCMAVEYLDAQSLKDALKGLLNDYVGVLGEGTVIYSSILMMERDNPLEEGTGGYVFRSVLEYEFGFDPTGIPIVVPPDVNVELDIDDVGLPQFNSGN
jgi:hypothetical protein